MKYIVLVPDGVADEPLSELGGKTPLEAALKPNMDRMARDGFSGLVKTIPDGLPPGSDIGNLSVLGYDPAKNFTGRAPLEAANLGIDLADDEVAFRSNLVTVKHGVMIDYSSGHISEDEAAQLMRAVDERLSDERVKFHTGKSYRHIAVLKSSGSDKFLKIKCTPPHDIMGQKISSYFPQGEGSDVLLDYMHESLHILESHPVNRARVKNGQSPATMIWLWGQGLRPQLPSYKEKFALEGSIISAVDLVNGIGRLIGLDVISVPGATGYYDTNYKGKAEYALKSLEKKDFVYVHVESTDEAGHNGDIKAKIKCIEDFDRDVVGTVLNYAESHDDVRVLVVPDHPTPVLKRTHTKDPVPFAMFGKGIERNNGKSYNEASAGAFGIKFQSGEAMVRFFLAQKV